MAAGTLSSWAFQQPQGLSTSHSFSGHILHLASAHHTLGFLLASLPSLVFSPALWSWSPTLSAPSFTPSASPLPFQPIQNLLQALSTHFHPVPALLLSSTSYSLIGWSHQPGGFLSFQNSTGLQARPMSSSPQKTLPQNQVITCPRYLCIFSHLRVSSCSGHFSLPTLHFIHQEIFGLLSSKHSLSPISFVFTQSVSYHPLSLTAVSEDFSSGLPL